MTGAGVIQLLAVHDGASYARCVAQGRPLLPEGASVPDSPKKPEQSTDNADQSKEKIADLPKKPITEQDAETVKGGLSSIKWK
jgi:hypothetical protein